MTDIAKRQLPAAAKRALAEAELRRTTTVAVSLAPETDGRKGLEPTRYGDWEKNGITSDF